eukprot:gene3205-2358_t
MSSRDRTVLDLYGELESMRMRYAPDPIIPQKADLYELSLHELWGRAKPSGQKRGHYNPFEPSSPSEAFVNGTELGHNTIAVATEAINEEALFLHAMKVFSHQPRIAHFMLCSTKANVLQEFCWPVDVVHDETTRMEDLFQKRDFFRSTFDNDRIGDTDLDRSLMLSNEVKSFTPLLLDGQAVWSENYHIVPRHRAFERILRQPPTVFVEMARNGIQEHVANDGFIAMKRPRLHTTSEPPPTRFRRPAPLITGKDIVQASVSSIPIEGMTMRSMPGLKPEEALSSLYAGRSSHERVLAPRSLGRAPSIQQSLKEQAFELTIARHLETMLDGLLEAVFQFLLPMLRIAAEDPLPVGTESTGTFKLSSRRPPTPGNPANTTVNEEEALLEYLSKSAALAIDSIRFHGDSSTSPRGNIDPPAEKPTDDEGLRYHLLDGDDTSSKRRRLEVECHREKLYVEYRPSATTAAGAASASSSASSSSSLVRRRPNTLRQPPRAASTTSTITTPSRTRRSMNASAAADVATAATPAGETGYLYHEPHINVHTGQFEDPVRRRSTAADAHPAPSTATTTATAAAAALPASSSSARIVNEERQRVNWEHILIVLELIRDIAMGDKPVQTGPGRLTEPIRLRIHPDLPAIPLDDLALTRIRYHLTAVFTNFLREHEAQHQPLKSTMKDRRPPSHAFLAAVPQVIRQPARYPRGCGGGGGSHGRPPPVTAPPSFLLFDHDTVHAIEADNDTATIATFDSANL